MYTKVLKCRQVSYMYAKAVNSHFKRHYLLFDTLILLVSSNILYDMSQEIYLISHDYVSFTSYMTFGEVTRHFSCVP